MTDAWVTVETFIDPVSAHVARSRLEAEGIVCFLADEGMGGLFTYSLVKGVRLQVQPGDRARAEEILASELPGEEQPGGEE